jgi:hypothetical protein
MHGCTVLLLGKLAVVIEILRSARIGHRANRLHSCGSRVGLAGDGIAGALLRGETAHVEA